MKAKNLEKLTLPDKDSNKTQLKTTAKAVSPKNTLAKGLLGWKSQKDLHKIINKNSQKSVTISNQSISSQIPENNETMEKKTQRLPKDLNTNINLKIVNSPKIVSEVNSPKTQNTQFFRAKNVLPDKQDENTKKIIQEKEEKMTVLENKILELEAKVDTLSQEKQKSHQIFVQIKNQKEVLEKNLQRLKNVANQNKKLLREKAEGFNTSGSQIMSLRAQLSQLTSLKKSITQIGINTEINIELNKQQPTTQSQPIKQQQIQATLAKNSQKLSSYLQILHNFLDPLQERLYFYEQTIYEQQKQLNEFYEHKQTRSNSKPSLSTDLSLLHQIKNSQELRQKLQKKQKQIYQLRQELWAKDRDLENLRLQIRVKEIFNVNVSEAVHEKEEKNNEGEILKLREQVDECKCNLNERDSRIKQLQSKVSQQQLIIRSLQEKKPKQIIK